MADFIDDYVDATGKFDYAKYKSENEIDTIHKVIINLIDELISQNKKSNFYLHTISNKLVSPFIDIIRNSKQFLNVDKNLFGNYSRIWSKLSNFGFFWLKTKYDGSM